MARAASLLAAVVAIAAGCERGDPASDPGADRQRQVARLRELARQASPRALDEAAEAIGHPDLRIARKAVQAVSRIRRPGGTAILRRVAAGDARASVRREAVVQLGQHKDLAAAAVLRRLGRTDPDPRVRSSAATALGHLGDPEAVPFLVDLAEGEPDPVVRSCAVGAVEHLVEASFRYDPRASEADQREALRRVREIAIPAAATLVRGRAERNGP
jgi:HEAT repeat protein